MSVDDLPRNVAGARKTGDAFQDELNERVRLRRATGDERPGVFERTKASVSLLRDSSREEVKAWLQAKNFSAACVDKLIGFTGADMYEVSRDDLKTICGFGEGVRVFAELEKEKEKHEPKAAFVGVQLKKTSKSEAVSVSAPPPPPPPAPEPIGAAKLKPVARATALPVVKEEDSEPEEDKAKPVWMRNLLKKKRKKEREEKEAAEAAAAAEAEAARLEEERKAAEEAAAKREAEEKEKAEKEKEGKSGKGKKGAARKAKGKKGAAKGRRKGKKVYSSEEEEEEKEKEEIDGDEEKEKKKKSGSDDDAESDSESSRRRRKKDRGRRKKPITDTDTSSDFARDASASEVDASSDEWAVEPKRSAKRSAAAKRMEERRKLSQQPLRKLSYDYQPPLYGPAAPTAPLYGGNAYGPPPPQPYGAPLPYGGLQHPSYGAPPYPGAAASFAPPYPVAAPELPYPTSTPWQSSAQPTFQAPMGGNQSFPPTGNPMMPSGSFPPPPPLQAHQPFHLPVSQANNQDGERITTQPIAQPLSQTSGGPEAVSPPLQPLQAPQPEVQPPPVSQAAQPPPPPVSQPSQPPPVTQAAQPPPPPPPPVSQSFQPVSQPTPPPPPVSQASGKPPTPPPAPAQPARPISPPLLPALFPPPPPPSQSNEPATSMSQPLPTSQLQLSEKDLQQIFPPPPSPPAQTFLPPPPPMSPPPPPPPPPSSEQVSGQETTIPVLFPPPPPPLLNQVKGPSSPPISRRNHPEE